MTPGSESHRESDDQWPRVKALFHATLDRPQDERASFLSSACEGDTALQRAIESLLESDRAAGSFLDVPAVERGVVERPHIRPLQPSTAGPSAELNALLRRRLRNATLVGVLAMSTFYAMRFLRLDFTTGYIWRTMVPGGAYLATMAAIAALLSRERGYSLSMLRLLEAVAFGVTTLFFVAETYVTLFVDPGWLVIYAQRHQAEMSILARQPSIIWIVLIVVYGTFIPNTGRRCGAVTTMMAVSPLAAVGWGGWAGAAVPPRLLLLFLAEMAMWMGCAVAIAIYGSHKIATLNDEALAARHLGPYQLKQRIGHGGMADVYLAEHLLLKRPCAVKVIRPDRAGESAMLERFLREVQITATLTHPNTVQVFDYGQTRDGTVFCAMEYLSGLSLDALVERHGPLPAARTIFVLRQLCGALAEAHTAGLVHRDVKPSNVILGSRGGVHDVAKLLDFGLARVQSADALVPGLTQTGLIFGTPSYMSPEQAAGASGVDARSDLYSLGALAYYLIAGQPPFVRNTVAQTLVAHINEAVVPLRDCCEDVPADLEAVVLRCLAKEPDRRFVDATSLDRALGACHSAAGWTDERAADWWSTVTVAEAS